MRPILYLLSLFALPLFSYAQITNSLDSGLGLEVSPSHPSPGDSVTVSLNDYSGGVHGATIEWYYENESLDSAYNQRSVSVTAPAAGSSKKIRALLTKPNGSTETVSKTITPYYLDIILEPQTHVPNFYKGRALPSAGSAVNATALLSADKLLEGDYLYTWRLNDTVIQGGPLRGGSRISFTMPQDSYSTLSLTVSRLDGTVIAKRGVSVPVVMPKLLFYEVSTLYGLIERSLKEPFPLLGNSTTLRAEPYYLDSAIFNTPSVIAWEIDGNPVSGGANPYDIVLERTETTGQATLMFRVQSTTKLLQGAKKELVIDVL